METIDGVKFSQLLPESRFPLLASPDDGDVDLIDWVARHKESLDSMLVDRGAVLFRGFDVPSQEKFREITGTMAKLVDYVYRSTPRTKTGDKVYTSTEYPADSVIPMHCENAYKRDWPMKLFFYCAQPAEERGQTPLGDVVEVTKRIDPRIRETFREKKVMYVRNYGGGVDLSWEVVFQTDDRDEVEEFCEDHDIEYEWYKNDRLRTRQVCQSMAVHPHTGEELWFNQSQLFHFSSLDPKTREALLSVFKEDELPRNACYGDGSPIEESSLEEVRKAFAEHTIMFLWQLHDFLMVDNMSIAHGRNTFVGKRKILVAMGDLFSEIGGTAL